MKNYFPTLTNGITKLRQSPQLLWTLFVAIVIFIGFFVTASQFIEIAQKSQDRLIQVRIGSIQDSLAQIVPEKIEDTEFLHKVINDIVTRNQTIIEFKIAKVIDQNNIEVVASINEKDLGKLDVSEDYLVDLALIKSDDSITTELGGTERYFQTIRAFKNSEGEVIGFILTTQSLSEADQAINDDIKNSILIFLVIITVTMFLFFRHARIIDYISLYKKLKEVGQLKDDFISMASHELRTPLSIIRGYAEFLREDKNLSDQGLENAKRIDIAARQLDNLVNDMLDVSRIEQGRMKFDFANVDPVTITSSVVEDFKMQASEKSLDLNLNVQESGLINVDESRLRQVLVNVIGNALKYTQKGNVSVALKRDGGEIEIRVVDTGIGMSEAERKSLFDKFYRIKNKETQDIRGTGLGLWITKQIVESMNGRISIESIKGVGTHVIVRFPVVVG